MHMHTTMNEIRLEIWKIRNELLGINRRVYLNNLSIDQLVSEKLAIEPLINQNKELLCVFKAYKEILLDILNTKLDEENEPRSRTN